VTVITPEIEKELMVQYRRTRSPFKAAKAVGIAPADAWAIIDKHKDDQFEERFEGRGRPELERYAIATRRASERGWDNDAPAVAEARAAYEAGTHTMATGRDGQWLILYLIPLRRPVPARANYFKPEAF